ncbi:heme ABC transporter permease CcmC [Pelagibacteraceae bacterium]|jgi:heme exporter protein C|nr:heme ABC transporter permease CcmC [Pelagibacteraceae bacterium]|tara:strand:- start:169 stop:876 length:708 start_codon:yes stop_codon:yes gene_type:complete
MFRLFSTTNIYLFLDRVLKIINSVFLLLLVIALTFALALSPPDYIQGEVVRIMYIHVPSSWIGLACFASITFLSIINFIFKIKSTLLVNKCLAPIGLLFTCLSIITGSIWGQPTWGTWWAWDARLTSMIVLMFFYFFYILSIKLIKEKSVAIKVSSLIAILGSVNLPIIKYSVEWWNTLHQPASIKLSGTSTIDSSMMTPLLLMLLVLLLYCALIFLMKYKTEIIRIKRKNIKRL